MSGPVRLVAVFAALGAALPAAAQTTTKLVNTPAEKFAIAPGGVDMRTGRYAYSETDLSIGGESGLALTRILAADVKGHANPFGNLSHNWDIMVSESRPGGQDFQINVHYGGRSQTFRSRYDQSGFEHLSSGGAATLTYTGNRTTGPVIYTYTANDGTVAVFRPLGNECSVVRRCAYVAEIIEPDGTRLAFDYASVEGSGARLKSVTSSRGYRLLLEGAGYYVHKACVLNLAHMAAPADGLCPAGAPTASYAYMGVTGHLASATRPDGTVAGFTYGSTPQGRATMGFVKPVRPGDPTPAPWLVNEFHLRLDEEEVPQEIIDRQAFADGQTYSYAFNESPHTDGKLPTIAGGTYTDALNQTTQVLYDWPVAPTGAAQCTFQCPDPKATDPQMVWVYQQTSGPAKIVDPLDRTTVFDYCDPAAFNATQWREEHKCIVLANAQSFVDPEGPGPSSAMTAFTISSA